MWSPLPAILAFALWMLYLTTQSQLQERWYFADLALRSTLFINRKCCVFLISERCYILQTWVFVGPVGKFSSALCFSCNTTHLSTFPHDIHKLVENIHSNSGPSLGNISHIHKWERHHGEGCRRWSKFLVKCEWHSRWYLTSVPGAISLSDRGRRLHESWYLCRESSGAARHHLLIAKRNDSFYLGQIYFSGLK